MIPYPRPQSAPSPAQAGSPAAIPPIPIAQSPRYAYLVGRLRSRQITMEEATELFEVQQQIVATLSTPPPPPTPAARGPPSRPKAAGPLGVEVDDAVAYGLVGLGAAAGLFAAIVRRSQELRSPPTNPGKAASR